jgi:ferritin-like metal-binding protein YciE
MKFFSANLQDLRELYTNSLQKALDMEQQITKALPTMIEKSTDPQLKLAFSTHLRETQGHESSVQTILERVLGAANTEKCKVAAALISEAEDGIKDTNDPAVRDVILISAAQQVEHHEMAIYGTLRNWAEILGETEDATILEGILDEEKGADLLLTSISDRINPEAEVPVSAAA